MFCDFFLFFLENLDFNKFKKFKISYLVVKYCKGTLRSFKIQILHPSANAQMLSANLYFFKF